MNICTFDFETTGKCPMSAEPITGYFDFNNGENYHFKSKVDVWSEDAEKIHKISEFECSMFPDKKAALGGLCAYLQSLPSDTMFVLYSRPDVMGNYYHYDSAIIKMCFELYGLKYEMKNIVSAYTMAKDAHKQGLFVPNKKLSAKGRLMNDFTQSGVYEAMFGFKFDGAHDCVNDVMALKEIYSALDLCLRNGTSLGAREQMIMEL
tara:strand:- start:109 stop:726 length:618 start_codon:yes stop_codon:yes gene_type:complete